MADVFDTAAVRVSRRRNNSVVLSVFMFIAFTIIVFNAVILIHSRPQVRGWHSWQQRWNAVLFVVFGKDFLEMWVTLARCRKHRLHLMAGQFRDVSNRRSKRDAGKRDSPVVSCTMKGGASDWKEFSLKRSSWGRERLWEWPPRTNHVWPKAVTL